MGEPALDEVLGRSSLDQPADDDRALVAIPLDRDL